MVDLPISQPPGPRALITGVSGDLGLVSVRSPGTARSSSAPHLWSAGPREPS